MPQAIVALAAVVPDSKDRRIHRRTDLQFQVRLTRMADPDGLQPQHGGAGQGPEGWDGSGCTEDLSEGGLGLRWERTLGRPPTRKCFRAGLSFVGFHPGDLSGIQDCLAGRAPEL